MGKGRPRAGPLLRATGQDALENLLRKRNLGQGIALRGKIVLLCAQGISDSQVAKNLGLTRSTVGKWRKRHLSQGLNGLYDAPRPPRSIADADAGRAVRRTLESMPDDATHWSTRAMAAQSPSDSGGPAQKGALSRCVGRAKGGLNSKLHAVVIFYLN